MHNSYYTIDQKRALLAAIGEKFPNVALNSALVFKTNIELVQVLDVQKSTYSFNLKDANSNAPEYKMTGNEDAILPFMYKISIQETGKPETRVPHFVLVGAGAAQQAALAKIFYGRSSISANSQVLHPSIVNSDSLYNPGVVGAIGGTLNQSGYQDLSEDKVLFGGDTNILKIDFHPGSVADMLADVKDVEMILELKVWMYQGGVLSDGTNACIARV